MTGLVIYTAITGGKDKLRDPKHILPGAEYVCFTDTPGVRSSIFDIRALPFTEATPRLTARRLKLFPHLLFPQHETSLWVDGSRLIRGDLNGLLQEAGGAFMAAFTHPHRGCLYQEAELCARLGRDDPALLAAHIAQYRREGVPENLGLAETGVLLRRHHVPVVKTLMEAWWQQVATHSQRDQVSLPYVLWKHNFSLCRIDYARWYDRCFVQYPHAWHPSGDNRNGLGEIWRARLYLFGQLTGLQRYYDKMAVSMRTPRSAR